MALRKVNTELDALYNYFLDICEDKFSGGPFEFDSASGYKIQIPTQNNSMVYKHRLTYFMIDFYEKNGFPIVLSDNDYNHLSDARDKNLQAIPVYRGFSHKQFARNLLENFDYHYGDGIYGSGIYASNNIYRAEIYSGYGGGILVEYKINPKAKLINYDYFRQIADYVDEATNPRTAKSNNLKTLDVSQDTKEKLSKLIDFINSKDDKKFRQDCIFSNLIAVYLGYDVLERDLGGGTLDYIVLNRGALCVSQSQYDEIMSAESVKE